MTFFVRKSSALWVFVLVLSFGALCSGDFYSDNYRNYNTNDSRYHLKDYSGDLETMPSLLGDWRSKRNQMAEQGIIFEGGFTGVAQTNTRGGTNTHDTASIGGSMDF